MPSHAGLGGPLPVECVRECFQRLPGQRLGDPGKAGRKPGDGPTRPSSLHRGLQLAHPQSQGWCLVELNRVRGYQDHCGSALSCASFRWPKIPHAGLQRTNSQPVESAFVRPWKCITGVRWLGERLGLGSRSSATGSTFASNQPRRSSLGFSPGELGFRSLPRHANRIRGLLRLDCLRRMIEIVSLGLLARLPGAAIGLAGCSAPQALDRRPASRSCGGLATASWSSIASPVNIAFQAFSMRGISTGSRRCGSAWRARAAPRVDTHCRLGRHHWDWPTLDRRLRPFESDHTEPRRAGTATFWKKR